MADGVTYDLKLAADSPLDKTAVDDTVALATTHKWAPEQAQAVLTAREQSVLGYKTAQEAARPKAPDKYELKLGKDVPLDPSEVEAVTAFSKAAGYTNEQAQQELDRRAAIVTGYDTRNKAALAATRTQWEADVKADPDLGGAHLTSTLATTKAVMDRFAPEGSKFRAMLNETGFGNHPEVVRFIRAIGQAMREDTLVVRGSGGGRPDQKSPEEKLYPSMVKAS